MRHHSSWNNNVDGSPATRSSSKKSESARWNRGGGAPLVLPLFAEGGLDHTESTFLLTRGRSHGETWTRCLQASSFGGDDPQRGTDLATAAGDANELGKGVTMGGTPAAGLVFTCDVAIWLPRLGPALGGVFFVWLFLFGDVAALALKGVLLWRGLDWKGWIGGTRRSCWGIGEERNGTKWYRVKTLACLQRDLGIAWLF
jgi:hypothetical protein